MKKIIILLLFISVELLYAGELFYSSNEFGMALKEIGWYRRDEYTYILKIEKIENEETKILYKSGEEIKRWEIKPGEERVYIDNHISEIRFFDLSNRLIEEQILKEDKEFQKTLFYYSLKGLSHTMTYDGDGNYLYRDDYTLNAQGELRAVKRTTADNSFKSLSIVVSGGRLFEERSAAEDKDLIYRFNRDGKLYSREIWSEMGLLNQETINYSDGILDVSVEINTQTGRIVRKFYNEKGYLIKQLVEKNGVEIEKTEYILNESGQKIRMNRYSDSGIEQWYYSYDEEDSLIEEAYWIKGALEKIIWHEGENAYVEELYKDGKTFLRIYYESEKKVKEEFLEDGKVIRIREFNKNE